MVKLTIDNKSVEAKEGTTVLVAATAAHIYIPTLCYQETLSPEGACRLCAVEITENGKTGVTTACTYPVAEGLVVRTRAETALTARKLALELLLAQRPHSTRLAQLAAEMGVTEPQFNLKQKECILCRLCVRTCKERVGARAITFIAKGIDRDVEEARVEHSYEKCIGCDSCAYICPTAAITVKDVGDTRTLSTPSGKLTFKLKQCKVCGRYWTPEKQLDYIVKTVKMAPDAFDTCPDCRP
jgi:bidirectional [NiFe] hydrogenase diaphorase subunit